MTDPTQSADQTPDGSIQPPTQPTQSGVQSRIDELTGTIHEQRRQMDAQNSAMQDLIAQTAALAAKQNQYQAPPPQPQLPDGVDPSVVNYLAQQMNQAMSQQFQQLEAKMTSALGGVRQSQEMMEFQAAAQGYTPQVRQEAEKLMAAWKRNGFTGWKSEDAFIYAEGQLAKQARSTQNRNRPNGDGSDAVTPGGGSMPSPVRTLPPVKSDEELGRMSPGQQTDYWASRVGNSDITY